MRWSELDLSSQACKTRQFPAMDVMKLLCSVLVVAAHENPFDHINPYLAYGLGNYLARLTVPFFFVSSGYLCFRKTSFENFDCRITFRYAKKILQLYFIWVGIYIPQMICWYSVEKPNLRQALLSAFGDIFLVGYSQLWYMTAIVFAVVFLSVAIKRKISVHTIIIVGCFLYLVGLLGDTYFGLLKYIPFLQERMQSYLDYFVTTRNGLFEGVLFVGMGVLFAFQNVTIKQRTAVMGLVFSLCCMFMEAYMVEHFAIAIDYNLYISLVPASFFLFYCVMHTEISGFRYSKRMRTYSSLIYYTHMWIVFPIVPIIEKVVAKLTGNGYGMHSVLKFAVAMTGTILASFAIDRLQYRKGFQWLQKIH